MEDKIIKFTYERSFATRGGLPFSKKMWRDGYNKALQDVRNYIESLKVPADQMSHNRQTTESQMV